MMDFSRVSVGIFNQGKVLNSVRLLCLSVEVLTYATSIFVRDDDDVDDDDYDHDDSRSSLFVNGNIVLMRIGYAMRYQARRAIGSSFNFGSAFPYASDNESSRN